MSRGRFLIGRDVIPFTAPSFGLLTTATELALPGDKWKLGIVWEPTCPGADGTFDPCVVTPWLTEDAPPEKTDTWEHQVRGATPFTAYSMIQCSPVGSWDDLSTLNRQALIRSEEQFVEQVFWTGVVTAGADATVFPHLADDTEAIDGEDFLQPAATVVTATPQEIVIGLGMLEEAMKDCYPGVATIHMPYRLATIAMDHHLLVSRGGQMFTTSLGSKVVIGDYPGTAPDGTSTPGETWLYATGEVFFQRETQPHSFRPAESLDRDVNTVSMIAERTYVVGWDCCLLAVPIVNGEST